MNSGNAVSTTAKAPQKRDDEILSHISAYRITVPEVLGAIFFQGSDRSAVTKVLSRLTRAGHLECRDLYPPRKYWTLSPAAVRDRGLSEGFSSIGPQALAHSYATLYFCCSSESPFDRRHITRLELMRDRPQFAPKGLPAQDYFLESDGETTKLGFLVVDHGANYLRILRKCRDATQKRYVHESFRTLIDDGHFLIAIATYREEKRDRLLAALDSSEIRVSVPYTIEVIPGLKNLIPRKGTR